MYEQNTILTLKEQRQDDPETGEAFPYNRVKVVGPSPIDHSAGANSEWVGASGAGVIITPESNFGSTLDEPLGKLQALYDVESVPETLIDVAPQVRVINSTSQSAGPTPEEVFAADAPAYDPEAPRRPGAIKAAQEAAKSPLEDPRPKTSDGPLGPVPTVTVEPEDLP